MRFGVHTAAVEEIVSYADHGELFVRLESRADALWTVEPNWSRAIELAQSQDPPSGFSIWSDVCEAAVSAIGRSGSAPEGGAIEELFKLSDELGATVRRRLRSGPYVQIADEVAGDLFNCAYKRAHLGLTPHFFEIVFECYRKGGWPCGWQGDYPAGRLVAYGPS